MTDTEAALRVALQQDANVIHYGRHTKRPDDHAPLFEDCEHVRCADRRALLGPPRDPNDPADEGPA